MPLKEAAAKEAVGELARQLSENEERVGCTSQSNLHHLLLGAQSTKRSHSPSISAMSSMSVCPCGSATSASARSTDKFGR